jgi:hypothetical protein
MYEIAMGFQKYVRELACPQLTAVATRDEGLRSTPKGSTDIT